MIVGISLWKMLMPGSTHMLLTAGKENALHRNSRVRMKINTKATVCRNGFTRTTTVN